MNAPVVQEVREQARSWGEQPWFAVFPPPRLPAALLIPGVARITGRVAVAFVRRRAWEALVPRAGGDEGQTLGVLR